MGEKFPILKISCLQLRAAMIYVWMHQWNRFSVKKDIFFPVLYFQPLYNFDFFFYLNFLLHSFAALRCSSVHVLPLQQLSICESCKLWSNNLLSSTTIQSCRDWRYLSGKGTSWVKQFCPNISLIWEKQKKKKKKNKKENWIKFWNISCRSRLFGNPSVLKKKVLSIFACRCLNLVLC